MEVHQQLEALCYQKSKGTVATLFSFDRTQQECHLGKVISTDFCRAIPASSDESSTAHGPMLTQSLCPEGLNENNCVQSL